MTDALTFAPPVVLIVLGLWLAVSCRSPLVRCLGLGGVVLGVAELLLLDRWIDEGGWDAGLGGSGSLDVATALGWIASMIALLAAAVVLVFSVVVRSRVRARRDRCG